MMNGRTKNKKTRRRTTPRECRFDIWCTKIGIWDGLQYLLGGGHWRKGRSSSLVGLGSLEGVERVLGLSSPDADGSGRDQSTQTSSVGMADE